MGCACAAIRSARQCDAKLQDFYLVEWHPEAVSFGSWLFLLSVLLFGLEELWIAGTKSPDDLHDESGAGRCTGGDLGCSCDTYWAHGVSLNDLSFRIRSRKYSLALRR